MWITQLPMQCSFPAQWDDLLTYNANSLAVNSTVHSKFSDFQTSLVNPPTLIFLLLFLSLCKFLITCFYGPRNSLWFACGLCLKLIVLWNTSLSYRQNYGSKCGNKLALSQRRKSVSCNLKPVESCPHHHPLSVNPLIIYSMFTIPRELSCIFYYCF